MNFQKKPIGRTKMKQPYAELPIPDYSLLSCAVKIIIINGPNLNLLGKRETNIYGNESFESYFVKLKEMYSVVELEYYQSNVEGEIINKLQEAGSRYDGIILNAAGYSHTSVAIADAIAAIKTPVIEVHISNIYAREEYRHISLTGKNCKGVITGFGLDSYRLALEAFLKNTE
jgi:3-dehydroquinate dehydratase II